MSTCKMQGQDGSINVVKMEVGQIAQIMSWGSPPIPVGTTYSGFVSSYVQRCGKYLFVLGSDNKYWNNIPWGLQTKEWEKCVVRILDKTEVLELKNN